MGPGDPGGRLREVNAAESFSGDFFVGLLFVLLGGATFLLAWQIPPATLGETGDPGPRSFPLALGAVLLCGGLWEWFLVRRNPRKPGPVPDEAARWRVVQLALGLAVYAAVIPWLGFTLSTLIFAMLMMWRLGIRWWVAAGASVLLAVAIQLLFVRLFKVPLPPGFWQ
jgi:putative tricarboxylic transport membrane protein